MDWGSLWRSLAALGAFLGQQKLAERHPLAPWEALNSSAWLRVTTVLDSAQVCVRAPEVDDATRCLGWARRDADNFFRSPYADTRVYVQVAEGTTVVQIERPGLYRVGEQ